MPKKPDIQKTGLQNVGSEQAAWGPDEVELVGAILKVAGDQGGFSRRIGFRRAGRVRTGGEGRRRAGKFSKSSRTDASQSGLNPAGAVRRSSGAARSSGNSRSHWWNGIRIPGVLRRSRQNS